MERALEGAIGDHRARLDRLISYDATEDALRQMLASLKPHILHLRIATSSGPDYGTLMLATKPGTIVAASRELTKEIARAGVEVVVLHGSDSNDPTWNRGAIRLARTFAEDGIPATIVHTHGDVGDARLQFIREFYRAFCDGVSLETALSKARLALAGERMDWSSYALFTGRRELDSLALQRVPAP